MAQDAEQSTLGFLSSMWSKAQGVYKRNVVDPDLPGRVKETAQEAYNAAGNAAAHAQKMTREMYDPTTYNLTSASPSSTISRLLWRLIGLGHWVTSAIMYTLKVQIILFETYPVSFFGMWKCMCVSLYAQAQAVKSLSLLFAIFHVGSVLSHAVDLQAWLL